MDQTNFLHFSFGHFSGSYTPQLGVLWYSYNSLLSHKLQCVDIANQLLTRHSPLALLGQVDEWQRKGERDDICVPLSCTNY